MPSITFNFSAPDAQALLDALCARWDYPATVTDGTGATVPNPETQTAFVKRMVIADWRNAVVYYQAEQARKAAVTTPPTIT